MTEITPTGDMAARFAIATGITYSYVTSGPRKEAGFCDAHSIEHHYKAGPTLTCNPPIATRWCVNCGKRQRLEPETWRDYD